MGNRNLRLRWISVIALVLNAACAPQKVSFAPSDAGSQTNVNNGGGGGQCDNDLNTTTVLTKMLFIIDMSGSNEGVPGCTLGSGCTDPGKAMRFGSMNKFVTDYGNRTNFQWSFDIFQGTTASPLVNGFSSGAAMRAGIDTFMTMTDEGNTPYRAAMTLAEQAIANDPDLNSSQRPQYLIVFMSDGQPTDATNSEMMDEVDRLMALSPGRITFNTVYYGTGASNEAGLLQNMAIAGNGHFLNTNLNPTGLDFEIKDLIAVPCP